MKKLLLGALLLAACIRNNHNGTYVTHFDNEFISCDDTLIVSDGFVTKCSGFHRIRDGRVLPKEYFTKKWYRNSIDLPLMEFKDGHLILGTNTIYHKIN